jgi:hypothetical protein
MRILSYMSRLYMYKVCMTNHQSTILPKRNNSFCISVYFFCISDKLYSFCISDYFFGAHTVYPPQKKIFFSKFFFISFALFGPQIASR